MLNCPIGVLGKLPNRVGLNLYMNSISSVPLSDTWPLLDICFLFLFCFFVCLAVWPRMWMTSVWPPGLCTDQSGSVWPSSMNIHQTADLRFILCFIARKEKFKCNLISYNTKHCQAFCLPPNWPHFIYLNYKCLLSYLIEKSVTTQQISLIVLGAELFSMLNRWHVKQRNHPDPL